MKLDHRTVCYNCYRPKSFCMCTYITPVETKTKFIILMHPKEFRKTKNGTGHFTHLALPNSELYVGIDFTEHDRINEIIHDPHYSCYVLYPSKESIVLNHKSIVLESRKSVIFLIDATWPCSRAMLRASPNIDRLPKVSFSHTKSSAFTFKTQPQEYCLSTMESTLCLLELLNSHQVENIESQYLEKFLLPFHKMVEFQLSCNL